MQRSRTICLAAVLMALGSLGAAAAKPSAVAALAGRWRISIDGGRQSCSLRLSSAPSHHGYALTIGQECTDAFPLQSVTAWKPYDGMIVLMSETGFPVQTFEEAESGVFLSNSQPTLALRPDSGSPRLSQAPVRLAGRWTLGPASGPPFCVLRLEIDGRALAAQPCRGDWSAKAVARWRLANHNLTLLDSAGQTLGAFTQRDPNTFEDDRPGAPPVELWRPVR